MLILQCFLFCFCVYSVFSFLLIGSILNYIVYLGPFILYGLIKYYSLPKPDASVVNQILGENPLYDLRNRKGSEVSTGNLKTWSDEFDEHRSPNNSLVQSIGHRAYGLDAPENSIIAIKTCHEKGCKNIEIDVTLTKDNVPVTFHDNDLSRIAGKPFNLLDKTWDEINKFDISLNHPLSEKFKGETIPKFEDAVQLALSLKMVIFVDVKECKTEIIDAVLNLYKKFPELHTRSVVCGFNPLITYMEFEWIQTIQYSAAKLHATPLVKGSFSKCNLETLHLFHLKIRRQNPNIVCAVTWRPSFYSLSSYDPYYRVTSFGDQRHKNLPRHIAAVLMDYVFDWALYNIFYQLTGAVAILLAKDYISPHEVTTWTQKGLRVIAWTVNLPVEKMHFARVLGVSYITDTVVGDS